MRINPIIPIWLMAIICIALLLFKRKGVFPYIRQIIAVLLIFAINLRVMVPDNNVIYKDQEIDTHVLFVIDNTLSMVAQDYNGKHPRNEGVREDCNTIIEKLNGANFSVVSFDNMAHINSTYSHDSSFVQSSLDSITTIEPYYAKGSSLNVWKDLALHQLKSAKEKDNGDVVIFFISDGEITTNEQLESFKELGDYVDGGAVLGYGTPKGGIMEVDPYGEGMETVKDLTAEEWDTPAVSKIDENNLKKIAGDLGVSYINMNDKNGFDKVLTDILNNAKSDESEKKTTGYKDMYFIFLIPFLLLSIFEYVEYKRKR